MKTDTKVTLLYFLFLGVLTLVIGIGAIIYGNYSCRLRWWDSGMPMKYSSLTGCMVRIRPDTWVPADTVKEIR